MTEKYKNYLNSGTWRKKKRKLNSYYSIRGRESLNSLYFLCGKHHKEVHDYQKEYNLDVYFATRFLFEYYGKKINLPEKPEKVREPRWKKELRKEKMKKWNYYNKDFTKAIKTQNDEIKKNLERMYLKGSIDKQEYEEKIKKLSS